MENHQNGQGNAPGGSLRQSFDFMVIVACLLGGMMPPWFRKAGTCGTHYYGLGAVLAWFLIPIWGGLFFPREPAEPLIYFWGLTTILLFTNRMTCIWRYHRGYRPHSYYGGDSRLEYFFGARAKNLEPIVAIAAGVIVLSFNVPLGSYLCWAGGAHLVVLGYQSEMVAGRLRQMNDQKLEAEFFMERFQQEERE